MLFPIITYVFVYAVIISISIFIYDRGFVRDKQNFSSFSISIFLFIVPFFLGMFGKGGSNVRGSIYLDVLSYALICGGFYSTRFLNKMVNPYAKIPSYGFGLMLFLFGLLILWFNLV